MQERDKDMSTSENAKDNISQGHYDEMVKHSSTAHCIILALNSKVREFYNCDDLAQIEDGLVHLTGLAAWFRPNRKRNKAMAVFFLPILPEGTNAEEDTQCLLPLYLKSSIPLLNPTFIGHQTITSKEKKNLPLLFFQSSFIVSALKPHQR